VLKTLTGQGVWGNGCKIPRILNLGRRKCIVCFTPCSPYSLWSLCKYSQVHMGYQFANTYVFFIPASLSFPNFSAFLFNNPHYEALLYVIFLSHYFVFSPLNSKRCLWQETKFHTRNRKKKSKFDGTDFNHPYSNNNIKSRLIRTSQTSACLHGPRLLS
jgi:hypothetical protein